MPIYPFECPECEECQEVQLTIADYDTTDTFECQYCCFELTKDNRIMCAVNVTRASYVDGTKRKGFAENREMLELKKASYNMKPEDRKNIKKEIKTIERTGKS